MTSVFLLEYWGEVCGVFASHEDAERAKGKCHPTFLPGEFEIFEREIGVLSEDCTNRAPSLVVP